MSYINSAGASYYVSYLANNSENPNHTSHIYEMAEMSKIICIETIQEIVPQMIEEISSRIIKEVLNSEIDGSLQYDIHNVATLSIRAFNSMIKSEKWSQFISAAITDEIRKRIDEIDLTIKL